MTRILHVEDDLDIQEIAMMSLEMSGDFVVVQCSSGESAIKVAPEFQPDLLLLDVMMPGMNGQTVMEKLRQLPGLENVPAIFMTARAQPSEIEALIALGAIDVIIKPFDPIALPDQIKASLQKAKSSA